MAGLLLIVESKEDKRTFNVMTVSKRSCPSSQGNEE